MTVPAVRDRVAWDTIRYANVWEDADVLCEALAPVARGGRLLSIASAGDNALALLSLDPAEVVAVDLNPAQLACLELRVAAFRHLDDAALLPFLGLEPASERGATYRQLRDALGPEARDFWDGHPRAIARGVIHAGRFERYLRAFGRWVLPLVHGRRIREALRLERTPEDQRRFYTEEWDTWRWRALFRAFFSRTSMGRLGRDPAMFEYVEGRGAERILARTRHALAELPTHSNPYLAYILSGTFPPRALPTYLHPEHRPIIRQRLGRLRWVRGPAEAVEGSWDGFNLSDIWEYMSPAEFGRGYAALLERARSGARLVYWNLLAPRSCPPEQRHRVRPLAGLAADLHRRDRAWFYSALHVDEVVGEGAGGC